MQNEQQHLNEIGQTYSMYDKDMKVNAFRSRTIVSFTQGPRILELGCADGLVTESLIEKFGEIIAVDASEELLEKARQRAPRAQYIHSLFEDLSFDTQFDTIILGHVLEHVADPILILNHIKTWLAPGGRMIITVPNGESLHRRLGVEMGMIEYCTQLNDDDIRIGHRRVFTLHTMRTTVIAAGLNILKEEGILLKPLSNRQMFDWKDEMLEGFYQLAKKLPADFGGELCIICSRA